MGPEDTESEDFDGPPAFADLSVEGHQVQSTFEIYDSTCIVRTERDCEPGGDPFWWHILEMREGPARVTIHLGSVEEAREFFEHVMAEIEDAEADGPPAPRRS